MLQTQNQNVHNFKRADLDSNVTCNKPETININLWSFIHDFSDYFKNSIMISITESIASLAEWWETDLGVETSDHYSGQKSTKMSVCVKNKNCYWYNPNHSGPFDDIRHAVLDTEANFAMAYTNIIPLS